MTNIVFNGRKRFEKAADERQFECHTAKCAKKTPMSRSLSGFQCYLFSSDISTADINCVKKEMKFCFFFPVCAAAVSFTLDTA